MSLKFHEKEPEKKQTKTKQNLNIDSGGPAVDVL